MLIIPAHAKVNLCLALRGRRPDGFHDIDSVAMAIDWHDLVGVALRPAPVTSVQVAVSGPHAGDTPRGRENLVARTIDAVAERVGPLAATAWLDKRIPVMAGLGGGSADAAAVLTACAAAALSAGLGDGAARALDPGTLVALAGSLGADVPMALAGGMQRMRGRGEILEPIAGPALHLAVAVAGSSDTALTYRACEDFDFEDSRRVDRVLASLQAGRRPHDDDLGSGLEAPACRAQPALDERLAALRAAIPEVRWHLTGSGGAVFSLTANAVDAAELARSARLGGFAARACRAVASG
jgi:4-diphosphocytidyl-2-C-methyl-D-erythritol kinase